MMTTLLSFAVVISILVVVHELGHHLMAKWFGVPVEVFSVGFGPKLLAIRRGETEYRLSAIPFGGYVKMAGTSGRGQSTPGLPERLNGVPPANGFDSKPRWQRFLILLAGPVMNVVFALALAIVGLWVGIEIPTPNGPEPIAIIGRTAGSDSSCRQAITAGTTEILTTIGGLVTGELSPSHLIDRWA